MRENNLVGSEIDYQLEQFKTGFPELNVLDACTVGNGITLLSEAEETEYCSIFEIHSKELKCVKFVPASGAATRMFKHLYSYLDKCERNDKTLFFEFITNISKFPFYDSLSRELEKKGFDLSNLISKADYTQVIETLLKQDGLGYGDFPKALIKFHASATAIEEHLSEAIHYIASKDRILNLHFTISLEHIKLITDFLESVIPSYEKKSEVKYEVSFSVQDNKTDTIAVTLDNVPLKDDNGNLVYRPAGHGALLSNLNNLDADIVFIKNIDNVIPEKKNSNSIYYKKILGGVLIKNKKIINEFLTQLEQNTLSDNKLGEIRAYCSSVLNVFVPKHISKKSDVIHYLHSHLDRPFRVCGVVKNEGKPGGGPFWVINENGNKSLQIVEIAQFNTANVKHKNALLNSTHFNPVDLVCCFKDHKGVKYDLTKFRDDATGFITEKFQNGQTIKALELPGLWNGSMAYWNTLFIEVPIDTFNPVKTVNDLLSEMHQE